MKDFEPAKTREMLNHHVDSTAWNDFKFRDDDIVVATYPKSGTTWMQQIVAQLLAAGDPSAGLEGASWLDMRIIPTAFKLEKFAAQAHRRSIKTHLPLDTLCFSPSAKYLFVARDGRDVVWSMHHHLSHMNDHSIAIFNDPPGLAGPPVERPSADIRAFFLEWLDRDGFPFWSFWEAIGSWWAARDLPNVEIVHFNALKRDLPGSIRAIADFLAIDIDEACWCDIVRHCTFDYMKSQASHIFPIGDRGLIGGAREFINKGTNGRWADILSEADNSRYLESAERALGPACAHWLSTGEILNPS